jgi:hypothetical protein
MQLVREIYRRSEQSPVLYIIKEHSEKEESPVTLFLPAIVKMASGCCATETGAAWCQPPKLIFRPSCFFFRNQV